MDIQFAGTYEIKICVNIMARSSYQVELRMTMLLLIETIRALHPVVDKQPLALLRRSQ